MKIKTLITLFFAFIISACSAEPDARDTDGNAISLQNLQGKYVVINYWATWCKPCIEELPALQNLSEQYQDKIAVLAVNFDALPIEEIKAFSEKISVSLPMLQSFPLQKLLGIEHVATLPTTFILDPNGQLISTLHGPQTVASITQAAGIKRG